MDYSARVARTCGCVAQLVEQLTLNQWVWGSNPHAPTIIQKRLSRDFESLIFLSKYYKFKTICFLSEGGLLFGY